MFTDEPSYVDFAVPREMVKNTSGCAVNAMSFLLAQYGHSMPIGKICDLMGWAERVGVQNDKHGYQRLSKDWRSREFPITVRWDTWTTVEELLRELYEKKAGVPVIVHMHVLHFIKEQLDKGPKNFALEDVWDTNDKHVLVLVGHDPRNNMLLFVDPSYQLPWQDEEHIKKNLIRISRRDFTQSTIYYKNYISIRKEKGKKAKGRQVKLYE